MLANRAFAKCRFAKDAASGRSIWVYFPDEIYARGRIGFKDIGVNEVVRKFFVHAKSVANFKVKWDKEAYNIAGSENLKRAVRLACKHLREYTMADVLDETVELAVDSLNALRVADRRSCGDLLTELIERMHGGGDVEREFRNMISSGYEFINPKVREDIATYLDAVDNKQATISRKVRVSLVTVTNESELAPMTVRVTNSICPIDMVKENIAGQMHQYIMVDNYDEYSVEAVPENIRGAVSTLSIVEPNHYIDGVGIRVSNNVFYIMEDV